MEIKAYRAGFAVYLLVILALFASNAYGADCTSENVADLFPAANSETVRDHSAMLCSYYNDNIANHKQCALNEAVTSCERLTESELFDFLECMDLSKDKILTAKMNPVWEEARQICDRFNKRYNPSMAKERKKSFYATRSAKVENEGPLQVFVMAPFEVSVEYKDSNQREIQFQMRADNPANLWIGFESLNVNYIPERNLVVVEVKENQAPCGYTQREENGVIVLAGLTGVCLKKIKVNFPKSESIVVRRIGFDDFFNTLFTDDTDLHGLVDAIGAEDEAEELEVIQLELFKSK